MNKKLSQTKQKKCPVFNENLLGIQKEKKDINTTCPWESPDTGLDRWRLNQLS